MTYVTGKPRTDVLWVEMRPRLTDNVGQAAKIEERESAS